MSDNTTRDEREAIENIKTRIRETIPPYRDPDVVPSKAECDRDEARY